MDYSINFSLESYIKEAIMLPGITDCFDDEAFSVTSNTLQAGEIPFRRLDKDESKLTRKEQIYNHNDINSDDEIDVVNVDERNKKLFVESYKNKNILDYKSSNNIQAYNFCTTLDNNTIRIDQCSNKLAEDITLYQESVGLHEIHYSDTGEIYTSKHKRGIGNLQEDNNNKNIYINNNPKIVGNKDDTTTSPKTIQNKGVKLNTVIQVCPKCTRKEKVLNVRQMRINCQACMELMKYECLMCGERKNSISRIYSHLSECGQQKIYQCVECNYAGKSEHLFRRHMTNQHHNTKLECPKCGKKIAKNSMSRHNEGCNIHVQYLRCKFCPFSTKYKYKILTHIRKAHENLKPHQYAPIIQNIIEEGEQIKANALNSSDDSNVATLSITIEYKEFIQLYCKQCNEIYVIADSRYEQHCRKCGKATLLQCVKCSKCYMKVSSLYTHLKEKCTAQNHFQCAHCDYTSTCKRTLEIHIKRRHTFVAPEDYEKCSKCDKQFKHRPDRIKHERLFHQDTMSQSLPFQKQCQALLLFAHR